MKVYVGIGSNQGDRRAALEVAAVSLKGLVRGAKLRTSPIYETPALVPEGAPNEWRSPYLNAVAEFEFEGSPLELLTGLKAAERAQGRVDGPRWSPRPVDLDLIAAFENGKQVRVAQADLQVPHAAAWDRAFVIDPLKDLAPSLRFGDHIKSVCSRAKELPGHAPLWMGILNLTPDSFSDGGELASEAALLARLHEFDASGGQALDLGGESTRPGAATVSPTEEWARLEPALDAISVRYRDLAFRPIVSVDTRRASVASRALASGADWINDVSGLSDPEMASVVRESGCEYVLMHSLTVPADKSVTLPDGVDPIAEIMHWARTKLEVLERAGVSLDRVVFDPGVGFGKTGSQSLEILRRAREFSDLPVRILIGHSRKSFMRRWTGAPASDLDPESVGVTMRIAPWADIVRVHRPALHARAHRAFQESGSWIP